MEGIIKAVTIDPVKLGEGSQPSATAIVKLYFNADALAALLTDAGLDLANYSVTYISYTSDGDIVLDNMHLADAVESGHEISTYFEADAAFNLG